MDNMKVKYRILHIDKKSHNLIVRYFTDEISEEEMSNLLDDNGNPVLNEKGYPVRCRTDVVHTIRDHDVSADEIHAYLQKHAPVGFFREYLKLKDPNFKTVLHEDHFTIGEVHEYEHDLTPAPPPNVVNNTILTDDDIEKILEYVKENNKT